MAENQRERKNLVVAQTYLENKGLQPLSDDYTEEKLQEKFAADMNSLQEKLNEFEEYRLGLDEMNTRQKSTAEGETAEMSEEELSKEYIYLNRSRQPVQKKYDTAKQYADYLHEYGDEFARLYQIKDNNEKYGNPEKLEFVEVDITDNGDLLTQDQYFKMRADREDRAKQLALRVTDETAGVDYNIGMMKYNRPNMPPQIKMQLSFGDETLQNLDDEKLKAVFDFCEQHGLSVLDMEIRNFDGTLADAAIREKINKTLNEIKERKQAEINEANAKEYAAWQQRKKELNAELQNISLAGNGILPEGMLSEDEISYDLPEADMMSFNVAYEDDVLAAETPAAAENAPEKSGKVKRIARGVASAAIPDKDVPDNLDEHALEHTENYAQEAAGTVNAARSVSVPASPLQNIIPTRKKVTQKDAVKLFEKFVQEGLQKEKNLSYFKSNTGWFGNGWTEFIIYDTEDPDNRKKDGVKNSKDGTVKYTYSLKMFINVDSAGVLHFAYRLPNHKKIDETSLGGIVDMLKDLGYTAITFPSGMPKNEEKPLWRKAMAEKGIVPINMGLDSKKAEGMLKAAKEKLTAEELADYRYRLARQMNKHNRSKGKKVSESEQIFIDGLINTYYYSAFTDAYAKVLKSKVKGILRIQDPYEGAVKKIAAYRALLRTFEVYKSALEHGGNVMSADGVRDLSPKERAELQTLTGPVNKFNNKQMEKLFEILYDNDIKTTKQTEYYLRDQLIQKSYGEASVYGPRAAPHIALREVCNTTVGTCDSINDDLASLGVEKIELIKIANVRLDFDKFNKVYLPEYRRLHPSHSASSRGDSAAPVVQSDEQGDESVSLSSATRQDSAVVRNIAQNKTQTYH